MGAVVGAILILAGSVLVGAGIIADGFNSGRGNGFTGYVLGGLLAFIGFFILVSGPVKRATKRADEKKSGPSV